jgi:hypothetical protein
LHRFKNHTLAYCSTVHKCQGSEYDYILIIVKGGMWKRVGNPMLYTALSRSRTTCRVLFDSVTNINNELKLMQMHYDIHYTKLFTHRPSRFMLEKYELGVRCVCNHT